MSTPHNSAEKGQIAPVVLMPGDPLRAKVVADTFLEEALLVSSVRNIYAYTGNYQGKRISVMASGMGMPSIGIYSYELYSFYDVNAIIRIGSAGALDEKLHLNDIVIADSSYSESSYARVQCGDTSDIQYPDRELTDSLCQSAKKLNIPFIRGRVSSSDVFYAQKGEKEPEFLRDEKGCLCAEMESFALFSNAKVLGKRAACILTISDSLVTGQAMSARERQNGFTNMMRIALETAVRFL